MSACRDKKSKVKLCNMACSDVSVCSSSGYRLGLVHHRDIMAWWCGGAYRFRHAHLGRGSGEEARWYRFRHAHSGVDGDWGIIWASTRTQVTRQVKKEKQTTTNTEDGIVLAEESMYVKKLLSASPPSRQTNSSKLIV